MKLHLIFSYFCILFSFFSFSQEIVWKTSSNFNTRTNSLNTGSKHTTGDSYVISKSVLGMNTTGKFSITGFKQNRASISSKTKIGEFGLYLTSERDYSLAKIVKNSYAIVYNQSKKTISIQGPKGEIAIINNVSLASRDVLTIEKTDANKVKLSYNQNEYTVTDNFIEDIRVVVRAQVNNLVFSTATTGFALVTDIDYIAVTDTDKNWVWSRTFDNTGKVTSTGINYFDDLGKATQSQTRDF